MGNLNSCDNSRPVLTIGDLVIRENHVEYGEQFVTDITAGDGTIKYAVDGSAWFSRDQLQLVAPCTTQEQLDACLARIDEIYEAEAHGDDEEAQAHHVKMIGIDFRVRSGSSVLKRGWGEQWSYSPTCSPHICRPCHSGFPRTVLKRARECGAPLLYVGFNKNLSRDVGHVRSQLTVSLVGEERESMYLFR